MKDLVLAIDQGTTSSRAIVFNKNSEIVSSSQMELSIICPKSGWVEQNADEIWETVYQVCKEVLVSPSIKVENIKGIGITNQRETTIIWNKETKKPIYNAIVWQSRQSQDICDELINLGLNDKIKEKTGLIINPYFSATKIKWILENVKGAKKLAEEGKLLFGTVDTYLVWMLTEGRLHITDYTNASRTMLYNIHTLEWDQELLALLGIDKRMLPEVVNSSQIYGYATALKKINKHLNIPIASIIGDQQASLFGGCCFDMGDVKNTYGTGCFMLMNTKHKAVNSNHGLLTTIAWGIDGKIEYALEGSVFVGGSVVQWLRDGMEMIEKSNEVERYSDINHIPDSQGIYIVPAFVGLGTPYWDNDARGSVFGITRATKKRHFINAAVESIAYQSKDVMEVMKEEAKTPITSLGVDGGASINNYLMQFQADILNCKIVRPESLETTALGAAYLAGLALNVWESKAELKRLQRINQIFMPRMSEEKRETLYNGWKKAVEATRIFK
ncbi:MAG: glycerol kinase GlpK [Bacilli bacterium]|nr:glycerol kinase GlpK [Mollicutes bacterium]MDY3899598.1 glycerol kinase GlpK [Bacilli bacterium]